MINSKRSVVLALYLLTSCASDEAVLELSASSPVIASETVENSSDMPTEVRLAEVQLSEKSPNLSCSEIPACAVDEQKSPYQCVAYRYAGQLLWGSQRVYGWGKNLCEAKRSVATSACEAGKDLSQLSELSCSPDPSYGKCPPARPKCSTETKPNKCFATKYQGNELSWEQRPTAWGSNECEALYLIQVFACENGLDPEDLQNTVCADDLFPGQCPPALPTCDLDQREPTECVLSSVGSMVLKKPWRAIGTSACEARYRLEELICRFSDPKHPISLDEASQIECRALVGTRGAITR